MNSEVIRNERDDWVRAINKLCMDWKRKSQHVYEELRESAKSEGAIEECQSEYEREAETDRVQDNNGSIEGPPLTRPSVLAVNVSAPLPEPMLEPVYFTAPGLEQVPELKLPSTRLKTPEPQPEPDTVAQLVTVTSLVSASALIPSPPMPPPMPKKSKPKTQKERTKAFHWDVVIQDKVLYLNSCAKDITNMC